MQLKEQKHNGLAVSPRRL